MFKIAFESSENDADNYQDKNIFVASQEDVDFYQELGKLFSYCNGFGKGYGNSENDHKFIAEVVSDLLLKHTGLSESIVNLWSNSENIYDNLCDNVLGHPVDYDYGFYRVVESTKVVPVKPGCYIVMDGIEGVFISLRNSVNYRIGNHPLVNGKPDIFKMEWLDKTCELSEIQEVKEPTKVSLIVASI